MARDCIADMAADGFHGSQIDLGMGNGDTHTDYSSNPEASMNGFLDYMALMDAAVIVRTGSSFSGTVVAMRGLPCRHVHDTVLTRRGLSVCTSKGMPC